MAKLVYCDGEMAAEVEKIALTSVTGANIKNNPILTKDLRGNNQESVIIVTQQRLMRGFDYRSDDGIALLICKQLENKRAFLQAMGRVGRMGDEAQWYRLPGVGKGY